MVGKADGSRSPSRSPATETTSCWPPRCRCCCRRHPRSRSMERGRLRRGLGQRLARVGERIHPELDLEHWAAFGASFGQFVELLTGLATGARGRRPPRSPCSAATSTAATSPRWAPPRPGPRSAVYQAVAHRSTTCYRPGTGAGTQLVTSRPGGVAGRGMARLAGCASRGPWGYARLLVPRHALRPRVRRPPGRSRFDRTSRADPASPTSTPSANPNSPDPRRPRPRTPSRTPAHRAPVPHTGPVHPAPRPGTICARRRLTGAASVPIVAGGWNGRPNPALRVSSCPDGPLPGGMSRTPVTPAPPVPIIRRQCPSHAAGATWLGHPRRYPRSLTGRRPGITGHRNVPGTQEHQGPRPGPYAAAQTTVRAARTGHPRHMGRSRAGISCVTKAYWERRGIKSDTGPKPGRAVPVRPLPPSAPSADVRVRSDVRVHCPPRLVPRARISLPARRSRPHPFEPSSLPSVPRRF